jgi:cyclophilin family peptidyl-prolyl cis-trans isomerase
MREAASNRMFCEKSMKFRLLVPALIGLALISAPASAQEADETAPATQPLSTRVDADLSHEPENVLLLDLSDGGRVAIRLKPEWAPQHVARIKTLVNQGFYDGIVFHRVIDGFMAQTGDPTGTGSGGSDLPDLQAEFNSVPHMRGTVSMARTNDPDSANSQFFIMFYPRFSLDKKYTVFGRVIEGMQYVDAIARGEPPATPTRIVKARLEAGGTVPGAAQAPAISASDLSNSKSD